MNNLKFLYWFVGSMCAIHGVLWVGGMDYTSRSVPLAIGIAVSSIISLLVAGGATGKIDVS